MLGRERDRFHPTTDEYPGTEQEQEQPHALVEAQNLLSGRAKTFFLKPSRRSIPELLCVLWM